LSAQGPITSLSNRLDFELAKIETVSPFTHFVALERVGPSHTVESMALQPGMAESAVYRFLAEVPEEHRDRCHTMRGRDITDYMTPVDLLMSELPRFGISTIGKI